MSLPVIQVEGISKDFVINHEGKEKYTALRDVMANNTKKVFSFLPGRKSTASRHTKEQFWALQDISFDVKTGDRLGVIGRNGAGKSTLLKILSRITEPSKGRITMRGRVASLLEVGTGFHPELSGRENIFLNGAILGMSRSEVRKKFDEIVDFAEIEKFLDTPVKRYSSGMYVRLAFAVAAHLEPEILVVDEVLAVGDAEFQKKCLGKMNEVSQGEGRTVLFVSHNMGAISQLCNVGILLNKGRLMTQGTIEQVMQEYVSMESNLVEVYENKNPEHFHIGRVQALNQSGDPIFEYSAKIPVEITLTTPYRLNGLRLGVALNDKWKRKVFTTQYGIGENEFSSGTLVKKLMIPSHLLLSGSYSLDVASFIPNSTTYTYLRDICPFKVQDFESEFSIYSNGDVGVVNVECEWH